MDLSQEPQPQLQQPSQPVNRAPLYLFWLVLGLGAVLRLATLDRQSLWLDEGYSYWFANRSWSELLSLLSVYDTHPPLHYLILQPMIALGGSEWLLRLPSALASLACIGLLFALGEELFDRTTGLVASFIAAISPFQVWYAQEARMYALVAALSLAALLFLARALRTNQTQYWLMLGICEGLALLTDVAAAWLVLAVNIAWLLELRKHWHAHRFWPWLAAQLLAFLLFLPWLPSFLRQASNGDAIGWIRQARLTDVAATVVDFIGNYGQWSTPEFQLGLAVLAISLVAVARPLVREVGTERTKYLMIACCFAVPIGFAFLVSQPYFRLPLLSAVLGPHYSIFLTRNLIVASIPVYLLLARGLVLARSSAMAHGLVLPVVLVALAGMACASYYQNVLPESKEDYRAAAEIVRSQATPNDLIIFVPKFIKAPFVYYCDRPSGSTAFPDLVNGIIGDSALPSNTSLSSLSNAHEHVWLITNPDDVFGSGASIFGTDDSNVENIGNVLEAEGMLLYSKRLTGISVSLYDVTEAR